MLAWARAWEHRDLPAYFGSYVRDFTPGGGVSHAAWVAQRKALISDKRDIRIDVRDLHIRIDGKNAVAHFRQIYTSGNLHFNSLKTLRLVRYGNRWYITREIVG